MGHITLTYGPQLYTCISERPHATRMRYPMFVVRVCVWHEYIWTETIRRNKTNYERRTVIELYYCNRNGVACGANHTIGRGLSICRWFKLTCNYTGSIHWIIALSQLDRKLSSSLDKSCDHILCFIRTKHFIHQIHHLLRSKLLSSNAFGEYAPQQWRPNE